MSQSGKDYHESLKVDRYLYLPTYTPIYQQENQFHMAIEIERAPHVLSFQARAKQREEWLQRGQEKEQVMLSSTLIQTLFYNCWLTLIRKTFCKTTSSTHRALWCATVLSNSETIKEKTQSNRKAKTKVTLLQGVQSQGFGATSSLKYQTIS